MGEAGAFPNVSKTFSRWFPAAERGTAQGIFFAGAHLGGGLTPLLVARPPERHALADGLRGLRDGRIRLGGGLVPLVPRRAGRSSRGQPGRAEIHRIRPAADQPHRLDAQSFGRILTDRNMMALCLMYFTQAYGFYFNITWLPTYLEKARGFSGPGWDCWRGCR